MARNHDDDQRQAVVGDKSTVRSQLGPRLLLATIVLLVVFSRLLQARESLWLDELHTAWTAGAAWADVARRAAAGNHSPLFFWLEWVLVRAHGASELTLRLPSLVAGVLLPLVLFRVTHGWTGSAWLGLLPAWLVAVDPQAIYFGTEARPYALIQLLAVVHIALFARVVEQPTVGRRVALVAGMSCLFYLHYTAILLFAAELTYFVVLRIRRLGRVPYGWRALAVDVSAVVLLSLGALGNLRAIYVRHVNWESFVVQRPPWQAILMVPWAWTAIALLATAALVRLRIQRDASPPRPDELSNARWLALCWLLVPLLIAWLATASDVARLLHPRYLAAAEPAALVLAALALHSMPWRRLQATLAFALAVVGLVGSRIPTELVAHSRLIAFRADDWRSAIDYFNRQPGHSRDPVLLRSLLIESEALATSEDPKLRAYCLYPVTSLYRIDAFDDRLIPLPRTDSWNLSASNLRRVRAAPGFWLIVGASDLWASEIERQFLRTVMQLATERTPGGSFTWTITAKEIFGSVRVLRFDRVANE